MSRNKSPTPEWSHRIAAADIGATPLNIRIEADGQQRSDIARRLKVTTVALLVADLTVTRDSGKMVLHVAGILRGQVIQPCVRTLEPVPQDVETAVEGWFADAESAVTLARARHERQGRKAGAELPILEEWEDPEPLDAGMIDLGELATQHLALAVAPYPMKPGGETVDSLAGITVALQSESDDQENIPSLRRNPFAALKNWKRGKSGEK